MSGQTFIPQLQNYFLSVQEKDLVVNNSIDFVDTDIIFPMKAEKSYYGQVTAYVESNTGVSINTKLADIPTFRNAVWDDEAPFTIPIANSMSRGTTTGVIKSIFRFIFISPTENRTMRLQFSQQNIDPSDTRFFKGSFGMWWES